MSGRRESEIVMVEHDGVWMTREAAADALYDPAANYLDADAYEGWGGGPDRPLGVIGSLLAWLGGR